MDKDFFENYYYISQIAIKRDFQGKGFGAIILNYILDNIEDLPLIASVHKGNTKSINLFNEFFTNYASKGNYSRFMDNYSYRLIHENIPSRGSL